MRGGDSRDAISDQVSGPGDGSGITPSSRAAPDGPTPFLYPSPEQAGRPARAALHRPTPLPASVYPLLQVRGLLADGGVGAVAGQHEGLGWELPEQAILHGSDDGGEVPAGELGGARASREQGVPAEENRGPLQPEAHGPGGVSGSR